MIRLCVSIQWHKKADSAFDYLVDECCLSRLHLVEQLFLLGLHVLQTLLIVSLDGPQGLQG